MPCANKILLNRIWNLVKQSCGETPKIIVYHGKTYKKKTSIYHWLNASKNIELFENEKWNEPRSTLINDDNLVRKKLYIRYDIRYSRSRHGENNRGLCDSVQSILSGISDRGLGVFFFLYEIRFTPFHLKPMRGNEKSITAELLLREVVV